MKKTLKNTLKGAAIVSLALAAVSSAQAYQSLGGTYTQGDLLAGFTTGSGNDLIVNLGLESSLAVGQAWDLSSLLTANLATAANVQFGVFGDSAGPNKVYTTITGTTLPNHFGTSNPNSATAFNGINTALGSSSSGLAGLLGGNSSASVGYTATGVASWYSQTYGGGNSACLITKLGYSPDGNAGETPLSFYAVSQGTSGAITQIGNWNLSSSGILTFEAVPEPGTCGLVALGGGFLMLVGRNKLGRKQS